MNIYFFSYHPPDPQMTKHLEHPITTQFKGEISDIHSKGHLIWFTETLYIGGQRIIANHTIPTKSIVIVEAPPILQGDWLAAGVATLLIPQIQPETTPWGSVVLRYSGLIQIHKIEVITSPWNRNMNENSNQTASEKKPELTESDNSLLRTNLFQNLGWKPNKTVVSQ